MRKYTKILGMFFAMLALMLALVSCGECKHEDTRTVRENEVAATCTTDGSYDEVVRCSDCNEEISRTAKTVSALGHDEVSHEAKAPTCTEIGWDAYVTCSRCDYTTYEEKSALGHDEVSHEAKAQTCTEIGWDAYVGCSRCDYTTCVEIPALGHTEVEHEAKAPTCTEIGWNAYVTCSKCDYTTYAELPVSHSIVEHGAKAPTCTEIGWNAYVTCSKCDYTTYVEKAALGHDEVEHEAKAPTCTEIGWDAYVTCSRCDYTTYVEKAALGHDYENYICTNCDNEIIPSVGLKYTLSTDGTYYIVSGIGTCTDTELVIPLTYENLPVTSIGEYAFSGRTSLTSVTIPDSVTSIGYEAFRNCTSLTSVTIPDSVTSIGEYAFYYCTSLTYNEYDNAYYLGNEDNPYVVLIKAKSTDITSCEIHNDTKVIYSSAFRSCSSLTSVTIPDSVTSIGYEAFRNCTSLTSVTIPDSVTSIGEYAFYDCTSLTSVTFGDGVTSIGRSAFSGCTSLTSVTIPDSVTSIGVYAFEDCTSLTSVYITDIAAWCNISFKGYYTNPLYYAGNLYLNGELVTELVIPDSVTSIGDYAFGGCTSLTNIEIPDSVTSIGDYAFGGCTSLTNIEIPDSVTSIGKYAFYYCTALEEIYFNATAMNDLSSSNYVFYKAGQSGNGIKVVIGKNVTKIPAYLFYPYDDSSYAPKIVSVEFEEGSVCESIGKYAFEDCTSLTSVYITDIAAWCNISFGGSSANPLYYAGNLYLNGELVTELVIPDSITSIGYVAFYNCTSLTSLTIPDSVTSIGSYAFRYCYKLVEVINHSSLDITAGSDTNGYVAYYAKEVHSGKSKIVDVNGYLFYTYDGINYLLGYAGNDTELTLPDSYNGENYEIYKYAFYENDKITSVTIPDSVTSIGNYAFYYCTSLTSVTIGDSVTSIGYDAFYNCTSLTSVTIGDSVTSIGSYAFSYCTSLTSVTFGENSQLTSIGECAFKSCRSLTSITIPDSVTSIFSSAFSGCTALEEIYFNATAMNDLYYGNDVFWNAGQSGDGIKVVIGKNVTKIPAYLFCPRYDSSSYGPKIVSVEFEEGSVCESIGFVAFSNCTSLTSVYITDIAAWCNISFNGEANPLYYAGNLYLNGELVTELVIPDSVTSIGSSAFSGCTSLTNIEIPDSVTSIGSYAFRYCTSLSSITIPNSVTSIGSYAFNSCYKLVEVINHSSLDITAGSDTNGYVAYYAKEVHSGESKIVDVNGYLFYTYDGINYLLGYAGNDTELILPDSYNGEDYVIYEYAFCANHKITSVTIPDGFSSIGNYAFYNCTALEEIYFNATAMNDCASNLFYKAGQSGNGIKVVIGKNVTKIPANLFNSSSAPKIVSVEFEEGSVCESIGNGAFCNCTSLTSITIPDNVTSIGYDAFEDCTSLTSVTFGENSQLTSIGSSAFEDCTSLTSVTIPDSVTSIGYAAFYDCTSLTSVTIPDSVTSIGNYAFYNCTALEEIYFNATAMNDLSCDNYVFYNAGRSGNGIKVVIGKNVTKIPAYLFNPYSSSSYAPKIVSVEFEEGSVCESIGYYAFNYCTALEEIYFNATAMNDLSSNNYVFYNAGKNGDGIKVVIGKNVTKIPAYLFCPYSSSSYAPKIVSVEFEEGSVCESIGDSAFCWCTSLTSVTIPDSVTSIGGGAFLGCTSLTSVTIPDSVTSIGNSAFRGCTALEEIYFNAVAVDDLSSDNYVFYNAGKNGDGIKVVIGKNVTKIPAYLFCPYSSSYAPKIVSVEFEEGSVCESVGSSAFDGCTSLTSITIPDSVTSIGNSAFRYCTSLSSITVGENNTEYKSIDGNLYSKDGKTLIQYAVGKADTSFEIPDSVTSIGSYAFYKCTSLTSITIPDSVTSIDDDAFMHCTSLTSVTIGDSVTSIGSHAFYYCTSLTSVTIGDGVTSIGDYAFKDCTSLKNVYYYGTESEWSGITIGSYNTHLTNATRYYYSETAPEAAGNYWHYDEDGNIAIWE